MGYLNQNAQPVVEIHKGAPVGTIAEFQKDKVNASYLQCTGEKYDKNVYKDLFAYLGTDTLPFRDHEYRVGDVKWFPKRAHIHPDFVPADGQLLNRADYPDVESTIMGDKIHQTDDASFSGDSKYRGFWMTSLPDVFRVPDMNGKSLNTVGSLFIRGDGDKSNGSALIQGDAIRNITAGFRTPYSEVYAIIEGHLGAIYGEGRNVTTFMAGDRLVGPYGSPASGDRRENTKFDASRVVPTAPENRPTNLAGCWAVRVKSSTVFAIKAFATIENEGTVDVADLAKSIIELKQTIDELNSWPKTGSNQNGTWVKHKDGRLVCEIPILQDASMTGGGIINAGTKQFPMDFTAPPTILYGVSSLYPYDIMVNSEPHITGSNFASSVRNHGGAGINALFVTARAYGYWK